jgi:hypothetical protein
VLLSVRMHIITPYSQNSTPRSGTHAPNTGTPHSGKLPNVVEDMDEPVPATVVGIGTFVR